MILDQRIEPPTSICAYDRIDRAQYIMRKVSILSSILFEERLCLLEDNA